MISSICFLFNMPTWLLIKLVDKSAEVKILFFYFYLILTILFNPSNDIFAKCARKKFIFIPDRHFYCLLKQQSISSLSIDSYDRSNELELGLIHVYEVKPQKPDMLKGIFEFKRDRLKVQHFSLKIELSRFLS